MEKAIQILGTEYKVKTDNSIADDGLDGMCKTYDKVILIRDIENMLCKSDSTDVKKVRYDETMRHEIVHAFFHESGLSDYCADERLVDWISAQFPKMLAIFKNLGVV